MKLQRKKEKEADRTIQINQMTHKKTIKKMLKRTVIIPGLSVMWVYVNIFLMENASKEINVLIVIVLRTFHASFLLPKDFVTINRTASKYINYFIQRIGFLIKD